MNEQAITYALYKKLLRFYPRAFRERVGESMEQTFYDLCNEHKHGFFRGFFVLSLFTETALSIVREHLLLIREGDVMKMLLANPRSAAMISFLLSLPLGFPYVVLTFDVEPWAKLLNNWFTIPGQQGDINMLGRIVIYGGLLLLPVAFALNMKSMLKREGPEGKRKLHAINLIIGIAILLLIIFTWGGLIVEEIYCLRGIRCD